ncbi:MAG: hypothetical protein DME26_03985, partial [Verrucomicrobia bacterium]
MFLTKIDVNSISAGARVTDTNFHHVAVIKSGTSVVFYIDGVASPAASPYTDTFQFTTAAAIGVRADNVNNNNNNSFFGAIDELSVYSRALTSNEIAGVFNAGSAGKCTCVGVPNNLISWWRAEGSTNDNAGVNHGTLQNGATFTAAGKVGQAFSFDGVNDYVMIPKSPTLDPGNQVTIEFWMRGDPSNPLNGCCQGLVTSDFYLVEIINGGVHSTVSTDGGASFPSSGAVSISPDVWHHVAGTYDGSKLNLYIDRVLRASGAQSGSISPMLANSFLAIASEDGRRTCANCLGSRYFKGLIDEVSIYNRALNSNEIAAIFNAGSAGKCTFSVGSGGDCGNPIAIITTAGASGQVIVFPDAKASPSPSQKLLTGLPMFANPQGVSYYGSDNALIADPGNPRVFVVQVSNATVVDTINTASAGYTGAGTIAVAPDASAALANGDTSPAPGPATSKLYVIRAPFNASSTIDSVTIPGSIYSAQTQGILFNNAGRAFVYTRTGISALDPPYNSVAFTIPVSDNGNSGGIAITPDGNTLLAAAYDNRVRIFQAPFSASSTPHFLTMPSGDALNGIAVTPDGTKAIVAGAYSQKAAVISAPFSSSSTVEMLPIPSGTGGFEDVAISGDSQLAVLAGGGLFDPPVFIHAPFTAAGAQVYYLPLQTGSSTSRGAGALRFQPPCKSVSPTPGCPNFTGISPPSGGGPGTVVTISGTGLDGVTGVKFGNSAAVTPTPIDATSLTVKVPADATTGQITLTSKTGCNDVSVPGTFLIAPSGSTTLPGLKADYRFQHTRGSSCKLVLHPPDLVDLSGCPNEVES